MEIPPCPNCGSKNVEYVKKWEMKGRVQGKTRAESDPKKHNVIVVKLYRCMACDKSFRKGIQKKE